jgi:2-hydroxychromene-2-carboxylate isomerase
MTSDTAAQPIFYFDFNSPYAYLAAHRVDRLLGADVRWQPIAFAFVIRALDRTPWSFTDARPAGMRECEERAARYGLPELRWPPGWPVESYTLAPLRAALVAEEHGRLREFSLAAFAENFVHGTGVRPTAHLPPECRECRRCSSMASRSGATTASRRRPPGSPHRLRRWPPPGTAARRFRRSSASSRA